MNAGALHARAAILEAELVTQLRDRAARSRSDEERRQIAQLIEVVQADVNMHTKRANVYRTHKERRDEHALRRAEGLK